MKRYHKILSLKKKRPNSRPLTSESGHYQNYNNKFISFFALPSKEMESLVADISEGVSLEKEFKRGVLSGSWRTLREAETHFSLRTQRRRNIRKENLR